MEGRSVVWLLTALLLDLISAQDQNSLKYLEVDKKLVLRPEPGLFSGSIRSMSWKLNGSLVAVLDEGQPLVYNPVFGDRVNMDTTTGVLEIRNTMKNESGVYTVAINNKIQDGGYDVRVIKQVPKPELGVTPDTCPKESKSCSLICKGDITDAGPVTFYFKGAGGWEKENRTIFIDEKTRDVYTFSCRMENPLGHKDSEPVKNPFYRYDPTGAVAGGVVGVLIVAVAVAVAARICLKKPKNSSVTTNEASTKENGNQGEPLTNRSSSSKEDVEKL